MTRRSSSAWAIALVIVVCGRSIVAAAPGQPLYDWDFTPSLIRTSGRQSIHGYVTVRNLPNSPVNLSGTNWYALDMYPGAAAEPGGPFPITQLFSAGFESMNLAPGESAKVHVLTFRPPTPAAIGYSDLLIGGGHMRFLGPNNEFVDVGGLNKQLRVTVVPEPVAAQLAVVVGLAVMFGRRLVQRASLRGRSSSW